MEQTYTQDLEHTEEIQDIITIPPNWLMRWGITLFFAVIVMFVLLSAFIKYPELVKAQLRIESPNSPKPVVAKVSGKLVKLLVQDNTIVEKGQVLAYIESTANHKEVLDLLSELKNLQSEVSKGRPIGSLFFKQLNNGELGELQTSYQTFYQAYLSYRSSVDNGFFLKQKVYLQNDLKNIELQEKQLKAQQSFQQRDVNLAEDEYAMHKKLVTQKVETPAEFRQEESKYLARKYPLIQTEASLITSSSNYAAKQKEILILDNQILEEKGKFMQSLNSLISQAEDWKNKYVLSSSEPGKLVYAGLLQENQIMNSNQEVFNINPGNEQFFGEMIIPQASMGKIMEGQKVLIKLRSYPYEEYGMLHGKISYIADVPYRDSVFMSKVDFKIKGSSDMKKPIHLKPGMMADAEIITQDATILQRITRNLIKIIK
ncbi:MAG: HlyD family efflux transporter periplasmic adaptor subunit [Mucilaginibacter sp.]